MEDFLTILFILTIIPVLIFSLYAQIKVSSTFNKYRRIESKSGWVANEMSEMLFEKANITDVAVKRTSGSLTDNYNPTTKTLNLSETVYSSSSIASLAVAAHEVGHAIQDNRNYAPLKLRSVLVKVVNIGSFSALPLALIGIIVVIFASATESTSFAKFGEFILFAAIIAYSLTAVFALVTLPVELNASNRAKKLLIENNVLDKKELKGASKVLSAAAWTYVASLMVSIVYLLRFILILSRFTKRD